MKKKIFPFGVQLKASFEHMLLHSLFRALVLIFSSLFLRYLRLWVSNFFLSKSNRKTNQDGRGCSWRENLLIDVSNSFERPSAIQQRAILPVIKGMFYFSPWILLSFLILDCLISFDMTYSDKSCRS